MYSILQICKLWKSQIESRSLIQCAFHHDRSSMFFHNGFRKGKSNADTILILGKSASIKSFENIMDILWVDATTVVFNCDTD